jgi:hypothetical protein
VTQVPPLLDEETIKAVQARAADHRTFLKKGRDKHAWPLAHFAFCAECGSTLFGQVNSHGHRYYRHGKRDLAGRCKLNPRPWVDAARLEDAVFHDLVDLFGNPAAVQRAVDAATPNRKEIAEKAERLARVNAELERVRAAKQRVVRSVSAGTITDEEAAEEMRRLREREASLEDDSRTLSRQIADAPTAEQVREAAERVAQSVRKIVYADAVEIAQRARAAGLKPDDARDLLRRVFGGKTPDGRRMGVYVGTPVDARKRGKVWTYRILGRLIDRKGTTSTTAEEDLTQSVSC